MRYACLLLAIVSASLGAQVAQPHSELHDEVPGSISADRPGFGYSTDIAPPGVRQMESGFAFGSAWRDGVTQNTFTYKNPLMRVGIAKNVELRFGGNGYTFDQISSPGSFQTEQGWSDFAIGSKVALANQSTLMPAISALPSLSVPVGAKAFTSNGYDPAMAFIWAKNLPHAFTLGGVSGDAFVTDAGRHHSELFHSFSLSRGIAHGLSPYAELSYDHSRTLGPAPSWMVDEGTAKSFGRDLQVDAEYGESFAGQQGKVWFISAGVSLRTMGRAPRL